MPNLQKLSHEQQVAVLTTPFLAPATENPELETFFQGEKICETFSRLLRNIKYKLALPDTSQKIQLIGQKYQFELLRLANITRLIREYYFGEVRLENFPTEIEKRMAVSLLTAQEIARYIKSEIIDWDPWAEYVAKLPKIAVREMVERRPKLADAEITAGYLELKNSDDLEDPTLKNWIQDYVAHLGYEKHSQMDRAQYLFHSENAKNLSSPDREKLGIILKSFDENIPLPVDEENGEIVFDGMINEQRPTINRPITSNIQKLQPAPVKQEFIKPYAPVQQPQRPTPPQPAPPLPPFRPSGTFPRARFAGALARQAGKEEKERRNPEIDKYFNTADAPPIRIQSITEHNEPKNLPQPKYKIPEQTKIQPPKQPPRPQHKVIDPFGPRIVEPKLDGNIVDLSNSEK